ncbi:MAG: 5'-deoxynucleotidase [Clostridia bacterium]|nr:5'-deoxynucleotidase [Clostridia bacterium]
MRYDFYAYTDRMKYIKRWQLMRSVDEENIMEHSQQVTMFAHALAVINHRYFSGDVDTEKCVLYALYHECSEVVTGDLPTPIKYYNGSIKGAYKDIEAGACDMLLGVLPAEMKEEISPFMKPDTSSYEYKLMKAADRLAALVKCYEEIRCGNGEFAGARASIEEDLRGRNIPEVKYFMENLMEGFSRNLDDLQELK